MNRFHRGHKALQDSPETSAQTFWAGVAFISILVIILIIGSLLSV